MTTPPDIQIPDGIVTDKTFSPVFIRCPLTKLSSIIAIDQEQDPATWAEEWQMLQQFFWALNPTNPIEAVLAARVVDANYRGMEISKRAAQPDLLDEKFLRLHTSVNAAARALSAALSWLEKRQQHGSPAEPEPISVPLFTPALPAPTTSPLNGFANNRAAPGSPPRRRRARTQVRTAQSLTGDDLVSSTPGLRPMQLGIHLPHAG